MKVRPAWSICKEWNLQESPVSNGCLRLEECPDFEPGNEVHTSWGWSKTVSKPNPPLRFSALHCATSYALISIKVVLYSVTNQQRTFLLQLKHESCMREVVLFNISLKNTAWIFKSHKGSIFRSRVTFQEHEHLTGYVCFQRLSIYRKRL